MVRIISLLTICLLGRYSPTRSLRTTNKIIIHRRLTTSLNCESLMTIDEMKSELELRGVDYSECVSKKDLLDKLKETRSKGKADPNIFNKFNEIETNPDEFKQAVDSDIGKDITAKDGSLPGGLNPQLAKALASDPEIMSMLKNPKMQDIMKAVMTGGPDAMSKFIGDPEALKLLQKLTAAIQRSKQP